MNRPMTKYEKRVLYGAIIVGLVLDIVLCLDCCNVIDVTEFLTVR